MVTQRQVHYTPEDYLAFERAAGTRHEYLEGEIFAMPGAGPRHHRITANITTALTALLRGGPCMVVAGDMRVKVDATGLYTYPDVVAVCGPPALEGDWHDVLLNPTVIFEVLSPPTADYDRGVKFSHYRLLPTLTVYVLVAQNERRVDRYTRVHDGWASVGLRGLTAVLPLLALGCELPLAAIYDQVVFPLSGAV